MRKDLGNKLEAAYASLIQASANADKVKATKEKAAELTEVNKKLDESLEVLRQQVRVEERATAPRADYIAESVTAAVDEDEDVDVDEKEDEDEDEDKDEDEDEDEDDDDDDDVVVVGGGADNKHIHTYMTEGAERPLCGYRGPILVIGRCHA